jgi:hypothetical protein
MARQWNIARSDQDRIALASHQRAVKAMAGGFFDDLVIAVDGVARDGIPRADTSAERLASLKPAFDRASGKGTITAGNASPLTDGAAGVWVANEAGLAKLPAGRPRARLVDYELAAVDVFKEGLLMAPAYAIPRLLARNGLTLDSIDLCQPSSPASITSRRAETMPSISRVAACNAAPTAGRSPGSSEPIARRTSPIAESLPSSRDSAAASSSEVEALSTTATASFRADSSCSTCDICRGRLDLLTRFP